MPQLYKLTDTPELSPMVALLDYSDEISDLVHSLATRIYNGEKIIFNKDLLNSTVKPYIKGIEDGYHKSLSTVDYNSPDYKTLKKLTENVFQFSASKDFNMLRDMTAALKNSDGKIRSFDDFQSEVDKLDVKYNHNWLRTEYNQAVASSQAAARWTDYESDAKDNPYLQYQAVMDSNTRPDHAALHGIIKRYDDEFWDKYYPPNGWGCRCEVIQLPGKNYKETPPKDMKFVRVDDMWKVNVGKKGVVFPKGHPYSLSQCQTCNGPKLGLSNNYNPNNAQCRACLLGQQECKNYMGDCLRQYYVQKANILSG